MLAKYQGVDEVPLRRQGHDLTDTFLETIQALAQEQEGQECNQNIGSATAQERCEQHQKSGQ